MLKVEWIDAHREPKQEPNPKYPNGVSIDVSRGAAKACEVALPYPAKRIGIYVVTCAECDFKGAFTTAGRPDDPISVKVACCKPKPAN